MSTRDAIQSRRFQRAELFLRRIEEGEVRLVRLREPLEVHATEPRHYGMHRHFTAAGSILMFGGGIKKGFVYGKTAEERPCTTIENPVVVEDLHATMYHARGIPPDTSDMVERRPVYVTKDGTGRPILAQFGA